MWQDIEGFKVARLLFYDTAKFPFAEFLAKTVFKVPTLDKLHVYWSRHKQSKGLSSSLGYPDNMILRKAMQKLPDESAFYALYHGFVRDVIAPAFGNRISYSAHPKMRVHLSGTGSVSAWHRDADVTCRPEQINVWLPFTDTYAGNTLWVESDYGLRDFQPVDVPYGAALIFDGGSLEHGTVNNDTSSTRISIDFRFSLKSSEQVDAIVSAV